MAAPQPCGSSSPGSRSTPVGETDFIEQVAGVGGLALITLEPHDGLAAVTDAAAVELADLLAGYWTDYGVRSFVRFAHEMNGSWYPWAQQPAEYVAAFRRVAKAVHDRSPGSAMIWAPNEGSGYPSPADRSPQPRNRGTA